MQKIKEHSGEIDTAIDVGINKLSLFLKQKKELMKKLSYIAAVLGMLGLWIFLTSLGSSILLDEVLSSAFIISCLLLLKAMAPKGSMRKTH